MTGSSFYGRRRELAWLADQLEQVVSSGSGRLIAVRGRRQVGKSRLVEHFAGASAVPYGVVAGLKATPVEVQMWRAVETLASAARPLPALDAVTMPSPVNWYDLLARLRLAAGGGPAVLVIDEFPWAQETSPGLDGLLQSLWDTDLRRQPLLVVLIGSDAAMMDRLFEHDRPLFGRLSGTLVVGPFDPTETAESLGRARSPFEVFDAQLVTGGFPELVAHARKFSSVAKMIEDAVARPHSLLADVAQLNLAGEVPEASNARLVLEAIGADEIGVVNFSRIASLLGGGTAAETAVSRATDTLVETKRIVAIDLPAGSRNARLKRYRIADPYLRFWFRFVQPHLRNIEVGRSDLAVGAFHRSWPAWRGKAIEPLLREGFLRLAPRLAPPYDSIESVQGWWDRTGVHEFDVVGSDRRSAPIAVGSIKWKERGRFDSHDLVALAEARRVLPGGATSRLVAIAPRGAAAGVEADLVLDARDLVAAWGET